MCFSQQTSAAFAALGFMMTIFVWKRTRIPSLALGVGFFFLMELLQVFQYIWIDQCDSIINKILTVVGFAHICLQPYFTHLLSVSVVKSRRVLVQFQAVRKLCLIGGGLMFLRFLTHWQQLTPPTEACPSYEWLRGDTLCTYSGRYHLAWSVPLNDPTYFTTGIGIHSFLMFAPFFVIPRPMMWAQGLLLFFTGPVLAAIITPNLQEQASVWCFFSIAQLVFMLFAVRNYMTRQQSQAILNAHAQAEDTATADHQHLP